MRKKRLANQHVQSTSGYQGLLRQLIKYKNPKTAKR